MRTRVVSIHSMVAIALLLGAALASVSTAMAQSISFTSVTHNFGTVATGQSASYATFLTNNTGSGFPFSLTLGGTPGFISQTNCQSTVAAGATCEILFTFTSSNNGSVSTTWSVAANGATFTPSDGGTLTATGSGTPGFSVSVSGHNFGPQSVNTTSGVFGVVLANSTTDPISLSVTTTSVSGATFPLTNNNCGATMQPNSTCELQWTFTPHGAANYSAFYTVTGYDTVTGTEMILTCQGAQVLGVNLGGAGINSGQVTLSSSAYNFGEQGVSTTSPTFGAQLTNGTSSAVALSFSGSSPHFVLVANNCGATLAAYTSCDVQWTFNPQSAGTQQFSYQIAATSGGQPVPVVTPSGPVSSMTLTGTAITGTLQLRTDGHNFGPWVVGTTSNKYLTTLTNTTNVALDLSMGFGVGSNGPAFPLVGTTCGSTLAAGAHCAIEWEFTPNATGAVSALYAINAVDTTTNVSFAITTNNTTQRGVTLSGNGQAVAGVNLATAVQEFGETGVGGGSATYGTVLYNTSGSTAAVSFGYSNSAQAANFRLVANSCGASLATNATCSLQWEFTPTTTGNLTAVYDVNASVGGCSVTVTSGGEPVNGVTLEGTGVN
jgi:hypothetical protein